MKTNILNALVLVFSTLYFTCGKTTHNLETQIQYYPNGNKMAEGYKSQEGSCIGIWTYYSRTGNDSLKVKWSESLFSNHFISYPSTWNIIDYNENKEKPIFQGSTPDSDGNLNIILHSNVQIESYIAKYEKDVFSQLDSVKLLVDQLFEDTGRKVHLREYEGIKTSNKVRIFSTIIQSEEQLYDIGFEFLYEDDYKADIYFNIYTHFVSSIKNQDKNYIYSP